MNHGPQLVRSRIAPPLPLLVTGIAGVPGYNALPYFQARYPGQVIGVRQRDNWRLTGGAPQAGAWLHAAPLSAVTHLAHAS